MSGSTSKGRWELASVIVEDGWSIRRATEPFQCSPTTAEKWADRHRVGGQPAMADRSSRPHPSPSRTSAWRARRIINLCFTRRCGHPTSPISSPAAQHRRSSPAPLLDAPAATPGSEHRPGCPPAHASPLRASRTGRSDPDRQHRARRDSRRRWSPPTRMRQRGATKGRAPKASATRSWQAHQRPRLRVRPSRRRRPHPGGLLEEFR